MFGWLRRLLRREPPPPKIKPPPTALGNIDAAYKAVLSNQPRLPAPPPGLARGPSADLVIYDEVSDFDLLPDDQKALFEQIAPHAPEKTIRMPAPANQTTRDWVEERLKSGGYDPGARGRWENFLSEQGLAAVAVGYSMRYLGELKRRAEDRDKTLTMHELLVLRSRGLV